MFGLAEIRAMNRKAGEAAVAQGTWALRLPVGFSWPPEGRIPILVRPSYTGDFEMLIDLVVNSSPWGSPDDKALTIPQLGEQLRVLCAEHGPLHIAMWSLGVPGRGKLRVWKDR